MRNNLRAERVRAGFTIKDLAAKIGVSGNSVFRWEHGLSQPKADTLLKISTLLECDPEELLEESV